MADENAWNQELLKLRRDRAVQELALAARYPQTHTGIISRRKRTNGAIPATPAMGWLSPSVNPATPAATPIDLRETQKRVRDDSEVPASLAKPWKKPWDRW